MSFQNASFSGGMLNFGGLVIYSVSKKTFFMFVLRVLLLKMKSLSMKFAKEIIFFVLLG